MADDPYTILGIDSTASAAEIKSAYRQLVKKHHPDAGGDEKIIVEINAAWEVLGTYDSRQAYDDMRCSSLDPVEESKQREARNAQASVVAKAAQGQAAAEKDALLKWLKEIYNPINRLLGQIINPFSSELKNLSADPYDDSLMESFCLYIAKSQKLMNKIDQLYRSMPTPRSVHGFGLSLYHCLSQVQDALNELERYTMGYVDNYLHDGREMLREAKQRRLRLQEEQRRLEV